MAKVLVRIGAWSRAKYRLQSRGVELTATLVVAEQPLDRAIIYQYAVGTAYLIIGLFVYFRRGSAQKAQHFYILCLASFISLCFHYTGQFNTFDKVIYFGNLVAGLLAPTLFLHFCLTFPEPRPWFRGRGAHGSALRAGGPDVPGLRGLQFRRDEDLRAAAGTALDDGPRLDGGVDAALPDRRVGPVGRIQPDRRHGGAAAVEVAAQRSVLRDPAVRRVLRAAVRAGRGAEFVHEDERAERDADSAHAGLRDCALPADGRGHHLPPRLRLHAGHPLRAGGLLRASSSRWAAW